MISGFSSRRCYAVLAPVSRGYPPLKGRLVTCYSPGRHYTHGLLHFPVRLACVRHAASVDSEPGSNSRLKPDVCRRVVRQTAIPIARKDGMATTRIRRPSGLSCEIVRTFHPNSSLTTGTFNLVVKDRIACRLSGAPSVQKGPPGTDRSPPRHTLLSSKLV